MPEKKKKYLTRDQRDNRTAWIMLAPALLFLAVMIAYPLGKVIHDAFSQVNLIKPNVSGFAGLDNFKTILNDEHFWNDAKNTLTNPDLTAIILKLIHKCHEKEEYFSFARLERVRSVQAPRRGRRRSLWSRTAEFSLSCSV